MALTNTEIKNAKPAGVRSKLSDGGGLVLEISPKGVKTWKLQYRFAGKQRTLTLGRWPDISLADARKWREDTKAKLRAGEDPASEARAEKRRKTIGGDTVKEVCEEWLAKQTEKWKPRYHAWVVNRFEHDVYPVLGSMAIGEVEHEDVLALISRFEERDAVEIGRKTIRYVSKIMQYAIVTKRASKNPVSDAREAMKPRPKVKHFAKLPAKQLPEFFERLDRASADALTKLAIRWTMLTMTRTNESRFFRPEEIEGRGTAKLLWRIPPERMKMGREHLVPLPTQAEPLLDRIEAIRKGSGSEWMFAQINNPEKPMSENAMLYLLYRMGYKGVATMHGMRGLASTVLNEQVAGDEETRLFHADWIEMQLAHDESDAVRGAYNAAEYIGPRRRMLQWWANFLDDKEAVGNLL